jgi:hypothetical protein
MTLPHTKMDPKHNSHTWDTIRKLAKEGWAPKSIQEYHNFRLQAYSSKTRLPKEAVVTLLLSKHKAGVNIATHISEVIGENHFDYVQQLINLGENPMFIR